ncbi:MAG: ABC transporter ATP-binding protein/permease [Clostridia bacterium]|nr:ABC transporter ATP-binding protein/permease [Clostridia bacterium]
MLELKGITKTYTGEGEDVRALKGIDLQFRNSEFVAVLGPSGCGKTTLLNIIGGLDRFTSGDLIINGTSTGMYKERDWDAYRNHSVGFVFQSYNLIPHQTVLQNVELSLTLTGVSKKERRRRAREALEKVGLGDQTRKRPGLMSGGQCQRVAIARAIVNDPDIILADEPTGALDTETGIQVMEILKEISRDHLVIMVTHNPALAEKYATRTVNMLDGLITGDSRPLSQEESARELEASRVRQADARSRKLPSMSFATSFGLSLKNLFTKKGRTLLTSFAGSIGIIGIALIYAVSNGATVFIDSVQEETLSSYPITIEAQTIDVSYMVQMFMGNAESLTEHENDAVYQKTMLREMLNAMNSLEARKNDLASFKKYIEAETASEDSALSQALNGIKYTYGINMSVYTRNPGGEIMDSDAQSVMLQFMSKYVGIDMSGMLEMSNQTLLGSSYNDMMTQSSALWKELLPGRNGEPVNPVIEKQYDVVYGRWPSRYDECVLFVDEKNEVDDMTLYALGLIPQSEIDEMVQATLTRSAVDYSSRSWSYEDVCSKEFRVVLESDCWHYDAEAGVYRDLREAAAGLEMLYADGLSLHIVGIARPADGRIGASSNNYVGYTSLLTEYAAQKAGASPAVTAQTASPDTDIFTGLPFDSGDTRLTASEKAEAFLRYARRLDASGKAAAYKTVKSAPSEQDRQAYIDEAMSMLTRENMEALAEEYALSQGINASLVSTYLKRVDDEQLKTMFEPYIAEQFESEYASRVAAQFASSSEAELAAEFDALLNTLTQDEQAAYYDLLVKSSSSTYEQNMALLGSVDLDSPASISLYAASFADKDVITAAIQTYNEGADELAQLKYTDYVGLMMSSITTIINAISYVLMAFVGVSLIVSSIMIGVITLISVQERTKEIGILRAIGASRRNVSGMFNAETVLIGLASGIVGILITYLTCIPLNLILHSLTDISGLSAQLPPQVALILICISVLLTLLAGIIPSRSAAHKDPVVALRTE